MSIVVIGDRERRLIAKAKQAALKTPVPMAALRDMRFNKEDAVGAVMELKDRPPQYDRSKLPPTHSVMIPYGYRAAYSIEEQPGGLAAHLSIGTEGRKRKGIMPNEQCVKMIAEEFGIPFPPNGAAWIEEFEPGEYAVNLVHILQERTEGKT
jgi:hypothetical protein